MLIMFFRNSRVPFRNYSNSQLKFSSSSFDIVRSYYDLGIGHSIDLLFQFRELHFDIGFSSSKISPSNRQHIITPSSICYFWCQIIFPAKNTVRTGLTCCIFS